MNQIGLIFKCPMENEREDCPLKYIRSLKNNRDRIIEWDKLDHGKKLEIKKYHLNCIYTKH